MKSLNRVTLIGHLGGDPELKDVSGSPFTKFSLATSESYKDNDGEWHTRTEWHPVVVWGNRAEKIVQYCEKGTKIYMEGKLVHRSYQKEINGQPSTVYVTEVKLIDFSLAGGKVKSKLEEPQIDNPPAQDEDDLPF